MKTKPILIALASVILLAGTTCLLCCRNSAKPEKAEITQFLYGFSNRVNEGNAKALLALFEVNKAPKTLKRLANLLAGKKDMTGKGKPLARVDLDVDNSTIHVLDGDMVIANIPAKFSHDSLDSKKSLITLKIHQIAPHKFKIMQIDVRKFLTDYAEYANYVRSKTVPETDIFSPITLAAFKTAEQLKTRYDSVIWFAHVDKKTFYYVVKGKWDEDKDINRYKDSVIEPYKMGLLGPDLHEIIPVEYDLIHNIGGTFPGLVEVEKDKKKGFFDLEGKIVVPVNYDQIYPINDDVYLAALKNGSDYFYLKNDFSVSERVNLKIADFFYKIKYTGGDFDFYPNALSIVTEYNSRKENGIIYLAPSYLADLNLIERYKDFKNPLRKIAVVFGEEEDGIHKNYEVTFAGQSQQANNWIEAAFYSIKDYFLGGREGFYDKKSIVVIDRKNDRFFTSDIETDYSPMGGRLLEAPCDVNNLRIINDSLFEVKVGAVLYFELYDTTKDVVGGPYYHYLKIKNNNLVELPNTRNFAFTKYVKMDNSYLSGCYNMLIGTGFNNKRERKTVEHVTPEMLRYMKNEIFADYAYKFKDKRWEEVFEGMDSYSKQRNDNNFPNNINVDDSLTEIDKYNINFLNQKIKEAQSRAHTLGAK